MLPSPVRLTTRPLMHGDGRVDQVAAQRAQPRQDAILVHPGEPAIADHIRAKDRRKFPGLAHRAPEHRCQRKLRSNIAHNDAARNCREGNPKPIARTAALGRDLPVTEQPAFVAANVSMGGKRPVRMVAFRGLA